jgi:hypothetical protein
MPASLQTYVYHDNQFIKEKKKGYKFMNTEIQLFKRKLIWNDFAD